MACEKVNEIIRQIFLVSGSCGVIIKRANLALDSTSFCSHAAEAKTGSNLSVERCNPLANNEVPARGAGRCRNYAHLSFSRRPKAISKDGQRPLLPLHRHSPAPSRVASLPPQGEGLVSKKRHFGFPPPSSSRREKEGSHHTPSVMLGQPVGVRAKCPEHPCSSEVMDPRIKSEGDE